MLSTCLFNYMSISKKLIIFYPYSSGCLDVGVAAGGRVGGCFVLWGEIMIVSHNFALCADMTKIVAMKVTVLSAMSGGVRRLSVGGVGVASGVATVVICGGFVVVVGYGFSFLNALDVSSFDHSSNIRAGEGRRYGSIGVTLTARGGKGWSL